MCYEANIQHICSINEDALLSVQSLMSEDYYDKYVLANVILKLNDVAPDSKLLEIQVDITWEDKNKYVCDMQKNIRVLIVDTVIICKG